ncbi:MAG: N-acetyltransferase [Rhodospirillales bacterium]
MPLVARLFRDYEAWLGISLCFQGFDDEVAGLPGAYAPPAGGLWLARQEARAVGVVGLRPLDPPEVCEIKRLWVDPSAQGAGLGRRLTQTVLDAARARGYRILRLDSLPQLETALALYRDLGFQACPPYSDSHLPGMVFLEKDLRQSAPSERRDAPL